MAAEPRRTFEDRVGRFLVVFVVGVLPLAGLAFLILNKATNNRFMPAFAISDRFVPPPTPTATFVERREADDAGGRALLASFLERQRTFRSIGAQLMPRGTRLEVVANGMTRDWARNWCAAGDTAGANGDTNALAAVGFTRIDFMRSKEGPAVYVRDLNYRAR